MRINIVKNKDKNFPHEHDEIVSIFSLLRNHVFKIQVIFLMLHTIQHFIYYDFWMT